MLTEIIHPEPDPTTAFMDSEVERIKLEMLAEYDRAGMVDVAEFVNRYPMHRESVVDFWLWAKGTPREREGDPGPFIATDGDIAGGAIRDMCLSVNLGAAWLQEPIDLTNTKSL